MNDHLSPLAIASSLKEYWSPVVIGEVNDSYVKVAKVKGELAWHQHENEDELFMVLKGELLIELKEKTIHLSAGEVYIVGKGIPHNPVAKEECLLMLFEPKETQHTGDLQMEKTKTVEQQLAFVSPK